jgi:hypothetical protein
MGSLRHDAGSRLASRSAKLSQSVNEGSMIYVLEFFQRLDENGKKIHLTSEKRRLKTTEKASDYARSAISSLLFDGVKADGCNIKDQGGTLICEVSGDAA